MDFFAFFKSCGLRRDSTLWSEYERGKDLIRDYFPDDYEKGINYLRDYLWL